jgi:hypothetical protein
MRGVTPQDLPLPYNTATDTQYVSHLLHCIYSVAKCVAW